VTVTGSAMNLVLDAPNAPPVGSSHFIFIS
jgi:hypothetical protein